jgi:sec-independent protein translocase protein TatA
MAGFLSPAHIVVLLVVVLILFGAKRLPELGRSLGSGMREFKTSLTGDPEPAAALLPPAPAPHPEPTSAAQPVSGSIPADTQPPAA